MLAGDHLILSLGLAIYSSSKLNLNFVPTATLLILINCMDFDHSFYYFLDKGNANSLSLHPLHIYAGCIIFAVSLYGLMFKQFLPICYTVIAGITLHLSADALAYMFNYNLLILLMMTVMEFVLLIYLINQYVVKEAFWGLLVFSILAWCIQTSILFVLIMIFKIIPDKSFIFWLIPPGMTLILGIGFYFIFKEKNIIKNNNMPI